MYLKHKGVKDGLEFKRLKLHQSSNLAHNAQSASLFSPHCRTDSQLPLTHWLHSFSRRLFTVRATDSILTHTQTPNFFFSTCSCFFDISPALACKPSPRHLTASGAHSLSPALSLSLPPPATSAVAWRAGVERRAEETGEFARSKYSLYVCGVLSSKERRDRVHFLH